MMKLEILIHELLLMLKNFGLNVECVLLKEVHFESFSKYIEDSFKATLNSHQKVDPTSGSQSSRPSAIGISIFGYDGSKCGVDDVGDKVRWDIGECQQS